MRQRRCKCGRKLEPNRRVVCVTCAERSRVNRQLTEDDRSDMDRRGEYFDRDGNIQWRAAR